MGRSIQQETLAEIWRTTAGGPNGLNPAEVLERRANVGWNRIESNHGFRWLPMLVKHFTNFFSLLLYVSTLLCFFAERVQPKKKGK